MTSPRLPKMGDISRRDLLLAAPAAAAAFALVACGKSESTAKSPDSAAPDSGAPGATAAAGPSETHEWRVYGRDYAQSRTNLTETSITRDSVSRLAVVWEIADLVGVTGTPTVADGVVYFCDWKGQAWAVDHKTGAKIWTTQLGGMFVGAPAISDDAVYVAAGARLYRLNRTTGARQWDVATHDHPQAQISASPVVVDGIVLQGTASFENMIRKDEYLFRGSIGGFDAESGEQRWNFYSTAGDDTSGPGAGIWSTPAVDRERGLLFVGTGQGLAEPTPALADSLVAIDYKTGEKRWATQFTYPDVFSNANPGGKDADVGASPNLWASEGRELVGAGDKGGTYHALDRETGEVVWETQLAPGSAFGGEIGSAAYVDDTIVASSNVGDAATNAPTNVSHVFGLDPATGEKRWTSERFEGMIFAPVGAVPGVAFCGTDQGRLLALDTVDGSTVWSMDAPAKTACGPSIVDGRVVWGYGFMLFGGPGPGGVLALEVK